jgi:tetratricopeptide (TPR) repeat protein
MSVDFLYTDTSSYRTYLAGIHQREKIDIVIAKPVRAAVGSVEDIYGSEHAPLKDALRDFRYGHPDSPYEVLTVNLHYACAALDPIAADVVSGFQSLFDDDLPVRQAAADPGEADHLTERIAALAGRQQYADALRFVNAVLVEYPTICAEDRRFEWLRATLLAGIAGQPKSAAVVDLNAAERAFLKLAARAGCDRPAESAAALVAAGRCAYAGGRFSDAQAHYGGALERDPHAAEAHYQLARLGRHAGKLSLARECLVRACGIKFSFALRAASDPLFRQDVDLVRASVVAAARRAAAAARAMLREGLGLLRFLVRNSDRDFPAARLAGFAAARDGIATLAGEPAARTLRSALLQRQTAATTRPPVVRLAQDYCDLLRANEDAIALRGSARTRPAADPGRVARWLTRATEVSVAVALIAVVAGGFDFAAAASSPAWNTTASSFTLGLALAVANLWILMHTSFLRRPTRQFFERNVILAQAWSFARFERGIPDRVARNRRRLHKRIRRIERRFGLEPQS